MQKNRQIDKPLRRGTQKVGRPKDLEKQAAILRAANQQFMRHGFERVSMDTIAEKAGVSKLTIYGHFGSKDELFKTVIMQKCADSKVSDDYEKFLKLPCEEALTHIGARFIGLIFGKEIIEMHRIIIGEAAKKPRISELVYEAGPRRVRPKFAAFLSELDRQGKLSIPNAEKATVEFFTLLKGEPYFAALFNRAPRPSKKELEQHLKDCVSLFIRAYAA